MSRDIQLEIITNLLRSETGLRFSEAKPADIENDLYNYHLQQLIKKGLIAKHEDIYQLTEAGKITSNSIDALGNPKQFLKVAVLFSVLREQDGQLQIIAETRKRQPLYGDKGIMAGTVKRGERIVNAAKRKLEEETGLICNDFKFLGVIRKIRINQDSDVIDDTLFHLCIGTEFGGELVEHNEFGDHYWVSLDEIIAIEKHNNENWPELIDTYEMLKTVPPAQIPLFYSEAVNRLDKF